MEEGAAAKQLEPINKFEPNISHLLYADDVMIFLAASTDKAIDMNHIFTRIEETISLRINQTKSQLFFQQRCYV